MVYAFIFTLTALECLLVLVGPNNSLNGVGDTMDRFFTDLVFRFVNRASTRSTTSDRHGSCYVFSLVGSILVNRSNRHLYLLPFASEQPLNLSEDLLNGRTVQKTEGMFHENEILSLTSGGQS